jgi:hypothetical protein
MRHALLLLIVVGAAACGSNKAKTPPAEDTGPAAETDPGTGAGGTVTASEWHDYGAGPLKITGGTVGDAFAGDADCYAIDGDACGTDMSTGGKARVLHCTTISGSIECVPETGGLVTASQHLCCISVNGDGGELSVASAAN